MTNKEYAAQLLVEAAGILNDTPNYRTSLDESIMEGFEICDRVDIMCEYALNVIPYETTLTEGIGKLAKGAWKKLKDAGHAIWKAILSVINKIKSFFADLKNRKARRVAKKEGRVPSQQMVDRALQLLAKINQNPNSEEAAEYANEIKEMINSTSSYIPIAKGKDVPDYTRQLDRLKTIGAALDGQVDKQSRLLQALETKYNQADTISNLSTRVSGLQGTNAARQAEIDRLSAENSELKGRYKSMGGKFRDSVKANKGLQNVVSGLQAANGMSKKLLQVISLLTAQGYNVDSIDVEKGTARFSNSAGSKYTAKTGNDGNIKVSRKKSDRYGGDAYNDRIQKRVSEINGNESAVLDSLYNSLALCESAEEAAYILKSINAIEKGY